MIDADSILMIASLVGLGMSPLWAKWSNMALLKFKLSKGAHVAGVVCLSLLALALFYIGPWVFFDFST